MKRKIAVFAIICTSIFLLAGIPGLFAEFGIGDWYGNLKKPSFNPPNYLFGPVWFVLYVLMALSATIVYESKHKGRVVALTFFVLQFLLNITWSILFFSLHHLGGALLEIVVLEVFIVLFIIFSYRVNKWAALIQIPYALWVAFATVLNYSIWLLNTQT